MTDKVRCQLRSRFVVLLVILLGSLDILSTARAQCGSATGDKSRQAGQNKLAMYKITLRTYWSRARFPRHYPEWRPPAQFGKLIGRSHDANYVLYRLGKRLSAGARQYVETGRTDNLDTGGDSLNILHSFTGPAVPQGEGTSIAKAFLDGNHTLISVFARINPSPDWFVGVDSFQLCVEDNWVDLVTVELDPLDGGTDNGFTFTAANWPTQPQGIAYRITSRYPAHPAGSFYYPNLPRLPPIATLTFTKLREYTLTETYHEDDVEMEFISSENLLSNGGSSYLAGAAAAAPTPRGIDPNRDLNEAIAEERREMDTQRYRYWTPDNQSEYSVYGNKSMPTKSVIAPSAYSGAQSSVAELSSPPAAQQTSTTLATTIHSMRPLPSNSKQQEFQAQTWPYYQANRANVGPLKPYVGRVAPVKKLANDTAGIISSMGRDKVMATWKNVSGNSIEHQRRYRTKHHQLWLKGKRAKNRAPRDCKVSEWGAWSACSRTCGIGETQRTRRIVIRPRRGGLACPPLTETKWCGSPSPCRTPEPLGPYRW